MKTKDQLLLAATELIDKGQLTLRSVGDAIGVSQTAPYRHFKGGRKSIQEAVARETFRQVFEGLEEALRGAPSPLDALSICMREYVALARRYPLRHRLLFEIGGRGGLEEETQRAFDTVIGLIIAAQRAGQIRDISTAELTLLICATVHGLAHLNEIGSGGVIDLLLDLISATAGKRNLWQ